jgi:hypothetical protein
MKIKLLLLTYVSGLFVYALIQRNTVVLLPYVVALLIALVCQGLPMLFPMITPEFKQIAYLFLLSCGMQYLSLFMQLLTTDINLIVLDAAPLAPIVITALLMVRYALLYNLYTPAAVVLTCAPPVKESFVLVASTVKKQKQTLYYEIFDEFITQGKVAACL